METHLAPEIANFWWRLLAVVLLLVANGLFVAIEFALVGSRRGRFESLAQAGARGAKLALRVMAEPDRVLAAAQLGITMASLALGWIGEPFVSEVLRYGICHENLVFMWVPGVLQGQSTEPEPKYSVAIYNGSTRFVSSISGRSRLKPHVEKTNRTTCSQERARTASLLFVSIAPSARRQEPTGKLQVKRRKRHGTPARLTC